MSMRFDRKRVATLGRLQQQLAYSKLTVFVETEEKMANNKRYDLSDRLIHFFRNIDTKDGSAPELPEDWGPGNIADADTFHPLFMLRSAIRSRHLWATWSYRNNVRTIYGNNPAICFTDMPTAAFLESSQKRASRNQKMSGYALTFCKDQMFTLGARPVIYGLSGVGNSMPSGVGGHSRVINANLLPLHEQYRYVTYVPNIIDWTHEREWRLKCDDRSTPCVTDSCVTDSCVTDSCVTDFPGLSLDLQAICQIGVIVNTTDEANMILCDILTHVDRKIIPQDRYAYILVAGDIAELDNLRDYDAENRLLSTAAIDISLHLSPLPSDDEYVKLLWGLCKEVEREAQPYFYDRRSHDNGLSWIWFVDNFHPITRALLRAGYIEVNQGGKYLMNPYFDDSSSLRHREALVKLVIEKISEKFGLTTGYFSVLNSDNPDGEPSFSSNFLGNTVFYNHSCFDEVDDTEF